MTVDEIKAAVETGKTVCWLNPTHRVVQRAFGRWDIESLGYSTGLTKSDGRLNGKPEEFFVL